MRVRAAAVLVASVVVLATGVKAPSAGPLGKNGLIVFSSRTASAFGPIWTVMPTGARIRKVPRAGERPAWSPDGHLIAYADAQGLSLVRPDGSGLRQLGEGDDPAWSPDGKRIVTVTGEGDTFIDIINVSNGRRVRLDKLTDDGPGTPTQLQPAWSPDGRRIAFANDQEGVVLYNLVRRRIEYPRFDNADALAAQPLGNTPAHPSWSPDAKRIAFDTTGQENEVARSSSVFVARLNGTHVRRLARNASQPVWSPDGREIVFVRLITRSNAELFVMNADGTHQRRITFRPGFDSEPDWQRLPAARS